MVMDAFTGRRAGQCHADTDEIETRAFLLAASAAKQMKMETECAIIQTSV